MNKPQLYILSDIFGSSEEEWMKEYVRRLSPYFQIAVETLRIRLDAPDAILGFSVGGTIAWKYALEYPNARVCLISATRIRNEELKPSGPIHLYFGESEVHGPDQEWFNKHGLIPSIVKNEGHECYKVGHLIQQTCTNLLEDYRPVRK